MALLIFAIYKLLNANLSFADAEFCTGKVIDLKTVPLYFCAVEFVLK